MKNHGFRYSANRHIPFALVCHAAAQNKWLKLLKTLIVRTLDINNDWTRQACTTQKARRAKLTT